MKSVRIVLSAILGAALYFGPAAFVAAKPATKPEAPPGVSYKGGDGSDCQHAVIIRGAADEAQAVDARTKWLEWRYPSHTNVKEGTAGDCSGRLEFSSTAEGMKVGPMHDVITITTADGHEKKVWFGYKPPKFMFKPAVSSK